MPSPTGIFVGLSSDELAAIKTSAITRITSGETTGLSGAGKSKQKAWSMSAEEALREANFAIGLLNGTSPIRQTHFNASGQYFGQNNLIP
jgi:hypothetical protein